MGCPGQGCPWLRLNEVLGPGHSMTLPTDLHNPLLHQLYPSSPLDASSSRVWIETISCISFHVRVSFVLVVGRRAISESVQAQRCPVSCLGDTTSTGKTSPVSVSSTNRVDSCRMFFITRFPLMVWVGRLLFEQVKILHFGSRPHHVGFFRLPLPKRRGY